MVPLVLALTLITIFATRWLLHLRSLPPGPILPLTILRRLWWSKFYGKSNMEIFLTLNEDYGDKGMFSVHIGRRRVIVMTDFDKVQVDIQNPIQILIIHCLYSRHCLLWSKQSDIYIILIPQSRSFSGE